MLLLWQLVFKVFSLAPISYEKPKGVLKVREVLIEPSDSLKLLEAGITDITGGL